MNEHTYIYIYIHIYIYIYIVFIEYRHSTCLSNPCPSHCRTTAPRGDLVAATGRACGHSDGSSGQGPETLRRNREGQDLRIHRSSGCEIPRLVDDEFVDYNALDILRIVVIQYIGDLILPSGSD